MRSPLFLATLEPALERSEGIKFLTFAFWLQLCTLCCKGFDLSALISSKSALSVLSLLFLLRPCRPVLQRFLVYQRKSVQISGKILMFSCVLAMKF
jgi:hypothetical protein